MNGIQEYLCEDLFRLLDESQNGGACSVANTQVMVSFFEFYGGHAQDLLNDRQRLKLLEDGKNEIVVVGLTEIEATDAEHLKSLLEQGHEGRTTHQTEANDTSSRSHAICQICLKQRAKPNRLLGKISLVDLAGSERGSDTRSHNAQRRLESSEINTSLLSLKECIRALDQNNQSGRSSRIPYRGSKLTLLLKDCFTSPKALTTMIATISPGAASADHSLNTLRYADRIKEKRVRKSPQRSKSATSTLQRPLSLSPRRPVDATNHQHQPSSRRTTLANPKSALNSKVTTRKARSGVPVVGETRITRSVSARLGLRHSNSILTASSAESRLSYKSAPASNHIDIRSVPSRSFSGTSSADEELDSLLDDDFDLKNLSQDSDLADPPRVANSFNSSSRSETMFEPKPVIDSRSGSENFRHDAQESVESPSDDDLFMDSEVDRPTESIAVEEKPKDSITDGSNISLQEMFDKLHEQHMQYVSLLCLHQLCTSQRIQTYFARSFRMIQENATLLSREHQIQSEVDKAGGTAEAMDRYMLELERILDYREIMLANFQAQVDEYREAKSKSMV